MKTGLIGFGKTGRAVATVLLQHPGFELEWVLRKSGKQEGRRISNSFFLNNWPKKPLYSGHPTLH